MNKQTPAAFSHASSDLLSRRNDRIRRAKNFLLNPNFTLDEIRCELGSESLDQFNEVFSTIVGEEPERYRARMQFTISPREVFGSSSSETHETTFGKLVRQNHAADIGGANHFSSLFLTGRDSRFAFSGSADN